MSAPPLPRNLDLWVFLGLTFVLTWAVDLALWLAKVPPGPTWTAVVAGTMFLPAIATWFTERFVVKTPALAARTGLRVRAPDVRWGRYWLLAWFVTPAVVLASIGLSALMGFYVLDLVELSSLRAAVEASPQGREALEKVSLHQMLALNVASGILIAPLVNALPIFGEEWGWRGYLLPRLWSLGPWRALVLHGAIWGLWHAPIILMGYNYPKHPVLGVLLMVLLCVLMGILFGWLRLATGSVWPAVIAHASINGLAPLVSVLGKNGVDFDTALVGMTGLPGFLLLGALVGILVWRRQVPVPPPPAPLPDRPGENAPLPAS